MADDARPTYFGGTVVITSDDVWRAAIEAILQRLHCLAPAEVLELRTLLANPPARPIL